MKIPTFHVPMVPMLVLLWDRSSLLPHAGVCSWSLHLRRNVPLAISWPEVCIVILFAMHLLLSKSRRDGQGFSVPPPVTPFRKELQSENPLRL